MRSRTFGNKAGPSAAQLAGLAAASPAPSATNPLVTAASTGQAPTAASVWTTVAAGANAVILPAPPAGVVNYVKFLNVYNKSGALTAGYSIREGATNVIFLSALTTSIAANANLGQASAGQVVAGALTGYATGLGDVIFQVSYTQFPAAAFAMWQVSLTSAYQTIATATPAAGFAITRPLTLIGAFAGGNALTNADSASCTMLTRITRGTDAIVYTGGAVASNTRSSVWGNATNTTPDFQAGDLVEVKATLAPVGAGTLIFSGWYQVLPVQT